LKVSPNHPNPFDPETTIRCQLPQKQKVLLRIFNSVGREVRTLVNGEYDAGHHDSLWDARNNAGVRVASGVYLYQFRSDGFAQMKKMLLLR